MIKTHNKILKKYPLLLTMVLLLLTNRIDAQVTISGKTIAEDGSGIGGPHHDNRQADHINQCHEEI